MLHEVSLPGTFDVEGGFDFLVGNRKNRTQNLMEVAADNLIAVPAVERFGAGVPEADGALEIANDDGFGGEFEELGALAVVGFALAELFGAFGDAALEVGVEALELAGLAMELDEDANFRAQNFGNNGHGDIVDRTAAIAVDLVGIGEMDAGDEDDGGFAEPRVLADHVGELETVEFGHADIHENDGNIVLQKDVESLFGGRRLDEIFAKLGEDDLVAEKLGGLVVHHEDVDFLVRSHRFSEPSRSPLLAMQPHAKRGEQLLGVHRLGKVFRGARLEAFLTVALHGFGGEGNNG